MYYLSYLTTYNKNITIVRFKNKSLEESKEESVNVSVYFQRLVWRVKIPDKTTESFLLSSFIEDVSFQG